MPSASRNMASWPTAVTSARWPRVPLNAISDDVMRVGVTSDTTQLKLLSRNRFAFRLNPASPHVAYVSLGLGALKETIEFEDRTTGLAYDESQWAFVYELLAGAVYKVLNDDNLRIGVRAASAEPNRRVLFESWFNFGLGGRSVHRAYIGGNLGAVDSNAQPWSLGYQLGAGMVFRIADRAVFGIDYRYVAMPTFTAHTPGISLRYNF